MNQMPRADFAPSDLTSASLLGALLRMFRRELRETLRPELSTSYALSVADLMGLMLDHMEEWAHGTPYPEIDQVRATLAASEPAESRLVADFEDRGAVDERLERRVARLASQNAASALGELGAAVGAVFDDLYTAQAARHAKSRADDKELMGRIEIDLTAARVERYAAEKLGVRDEAVQSILKIPGGNSKDTFLATFDSGREWVIRRDLPASPGQTSAPDDLDLLQRLAVQGYPAPRAIAAERDPSYFGRPVLLMERVPGVDALGLAEADPHMGRFVALELARHLARLHRLDPADLGFKLPQGSACDQVRTYVARWRARWDQNRVHPFSLLETAFAWLDANIPVDIPRIVTVHGDARPANMMVDNGQISTLLDWEAAHPGDPNEDLQYAKGFVAPFVSWEDFVGAYAEAGGVPVSDAGARFYDVFRSVRNLVFVDASWKGFVSGANPSFKLAAQGVVYKRLLAHELAKSLRSAQW